MANIENQKSDSEGKNRLSIVKYFQEPEYSQFLEYCATYDLYFIDELKPYDYLAFGTHYKVEAEFIKKIRSKIETTKRQQIISTRDIQSVPSIKVVAEEDLSSPLDNIPEISWEHAVRAASEKYVNTPLTQTDLPARIRHRLMSAGITSIGKLLLLTPGELQSINYLGLLSLEIINNFSKNLVNQFINHSSLDSGIKLIPKQDEQTEQQTLETEIPAIKRSLKNNLSGGNNQKDQLSSGTIQKTVQELKGLPIDLLQLPVRAYNCLMRNGFSTIDKVFLSTDEQLLRHKNLGPLVLKQIRVSQNKFIQEYQFPILQYQLTKNSQNIEQFSQSRKLDLKSESSPMINDLHILLSSISESRLHNQLRPYIRLFNITNGNKKEYLCETFCDCATINDIQYHIDSIAQNIDQIQIKRFLKSLSISISTILDPILAEISKNDRAKQILIRRAHGDTLETISQELGVTRERIRQIEAKYSKKQNIGVVTRNLLYAISAELNGENVITSNDFFSIVPEPEIFWYLLQKQNIGEFKFDNNIECFYLSSEFDSILVYKLVSKLPKWIKESERNKLLSDIEKSSLVTRKYLDLVFLHYYERTGNIWHTGKINRGSMYSYIINQYFPNGIRIYNTDEIARFKKYFKEEFGDINFPESDRGFWASIQRTCILYDRGVYIHPSRVTISDELANKIEAYFVESGRTSMAYHELFTRFADKLITQANISNRYALQGILKEQWSDRYVFFRDGISTKEGYKVSQEIESFIKNNSPVSKEILRSAFSGVTEAMLMQNIARIPSVILGDTATFIHSDQLNLTDDDYSIRNIIKNFTDDRPITAGKLLEALYISNSDFLFRNNISTPSMLFGVLQYMFSEEFSFSRPYISSVNTENISKHEIILSLLEGQESIDITDLETLCEENHVSYQSTALLLNSLNDTFLRVDKDTLISITCIAVTNEKLTKINNLLADAIGSKRYLCLKTIDNYIFYPDLSYPWTSYLLHSIIEKYMAEDFILINNPTNRNVLFDFIVDTKLGIDNYEDLVRSVIRTEHQREPFKNLANIILWLVNEGFLPEKAVHQKEEQELLTSTTIQIENRNIPRFITDKSFIYVNSIGNLIIQ